MEELEQAFQYFDLDDRVRCVVVTSSGRIFCGGADLNPNVGSFQGGKERVSDHRDGYVATPHTPLVLDVMVQGVDHQAYSHSRTWNPPLLQREANS